MSAILPGIPTFRGPNYFVPDMKYSADVSENGMVRVDLGVYVTVDADGILDGQSINAAGSTTTFNVLYDDDNMGRYGRTVTVIASGAATSTVTVNGFDYLGQPVTETLTLNGANAVAGVKAFKEVREVEWGATASVTIDLGWGDRLGLPYRAVNTAIYNELISDAAPTAGAIVAGLARTTTGTATTADPRGLYVPHASFVPNGTRDYTFSYFADVEALHGTAHYSA